MEEKVKKEKKVRKSFSFTDKHPYLGVILQIVVACLVILLAASVVFSLVWGVIGAVTPRPAGAINENIYCVYSILIAAFMLILHRRRMGSSFTGYFGWDYYKLGLKLMIPWLAYWVIMTVIIAFCSKLGMPGLSVILLSLQAGVVEETIFRIMPLTFAMRHREKPRMILYSAIVSSVIFGVSHMANVNAGAPLDLTVFQTVSATMMGLFMAACLLRTGNILFTIVPHCLNDIIASTDLGQLGDSLIMSGSLQPYNFVDLGLTIIIGLLGLYMLRPSKHEEIKALWDKKMSLS